MVNHNDNEKKAPQGRYLLVLAFGALGIVYGDIGTSPLYALRESFHPAHGLAPTAANVLGILSLIFWALIIVISVKYMMFVMRADNNGEGGVMALTALVTPVNARRGGGRWLLVMLGLFGTALLYGDGMITPAISVLSAVEGLEVATSFFDPYIIRITVVILIALFAFQSRGTTGIGKLFGPVTLLWFVTMATLGLLQIVQEPGILAAINPLQAVDFFVRNQWSGFLVLGSVFLAVTGAEALYADLGHFGLRPIRLAWFVLVLPALLLNYFGQGALILAHPEAIENPFFLLAPSWALYPLVILATMATIIASQAVISGTFSLTRQAVQLGYLPRLNIIQTSGKEIGQIYIPIINWILMVACIGLVLGFRSSSNLAAAYGVGVTTDMVFTTILFAAFVRLVWKWSLWKTIPLIAFFLIIDLGFFGANIIKIPDGGWFPLVVSAIVFTIMTTWKRGRLILAQRYREMDSISPEGFIKNLEDEPQIRVLGTAVFMSGNPNNTPPALLNNLKHNKVLHKRVVFLAVETEETPRVYAADRAEVTDLGEGFFRVVLHYGFMENPNVPLALEKLELDGGSFDPEDTTYFLGRETLIATRDKPGMTIWRERLFAVMSRNAKSATSFFGIPNERVIEIGAQVEL